MTNVVMLAVWRGGVLKTLWRKEKTPFDAVLRLLQTGLLTGFSVNFFIVKCTLFPIKYETVEG